MTVLEMADRVMSRVTCKEISSFYETEHARHGVRIVHKLESAGAWLEIRSQAVSNQCSLMTVPSTGQIP